MKPLLIGILSVSSALAQQNQQQSTGLNARELFYTPQAQTQPAAQPEPPKPQPGKPKPPAPNGSSKSTASTAGKGTATPPETAAQKSPAGKTAVPDPGVAHTLQAAVPLGLRYSVLKRGENNQFAEVDPDYVFKSGDRVRFQVKTNAPGYLYVVMQGSSGSWQLLFPSKEVSGGSNLVQPGELRTVPPGDRGQFVFDEQAGTEKLFVVLTREPEPDLDKLIYAMGGPQGKASPDRVMLAGNSVGDEVVNRLRQEMSSRDLVFEKSDEDPSGHAEKAAYVANPSTAADARLVVDISLHHK